MTTKINLTNKILCYNEFKNKSIDLNSKTVKSGLVVLYFYFAKHFDAIHFIFA